MDIAEKLLKIVHRLRLLVGLGTWTQHLHIVGPDLGGILLLTLLVVIRSIANAAFNIQFIAFVNVLLHDLGQTFPENDIVPIRTIGHLRAILKRIALLGGSQTDACHSYALINIAYLRLNTHITNQHHLVHRSLYIVHCSLFNGLCLSKIVEMEILALDRGELAAFVNTLAQVVDDAVVTVQT